MKSVSLPCQLKDFETDINGEKATLFTLKNQNGLICQITNFGARVLSLFTPDRDNKLSDIVLGYNTLKEYLDNEEAYFGAIVGRVANRIAKAQFELDGKTYIIDSNKGQHHIHGGSLGFHNKIWKVVQATSDTLELELYSEDMEGGYPGNIKVRVTYSLLEENALRIEYHATSDRATPIALTNHSYFNLNGVGIGSIENHLLQIYSSKYTPTDKDQIPLGIIRSVEKTPFDFRSPKPIGFDIDREDEQLHFAEGYDQNFVIDGSGFRKAAAIIAPASGRQMEVYTTAPGMQFYSGNGLDGSLIGKNDKVYSFRSAFCLETQEFPNSVNCPKFPNTIITPKKPYHQICEYRFGFGS